MSVCVHVHKIIFAEYGLPCRLMSDAGTHLISEKFLDFHRFQDIHCVMSSLYNHQSNEQAICKAYSKEILRD